MENKEYKHQHFAKYVTGLKFQPEHYNKGEYKLYANPGEKYFLFLDIPFIIFPFKIIPYKRVTATETTWVSYDTVFPAEREIYTVSKAKRWNPRFRNIDGHLGWCAEVKIQWSDDTTDTKYFDTNEEAQQFFDYMVEKWGLSDTNIDC